MTAWENGFRQEKPTNCGTNFQADKRITNPLTILVHSQLLCAQRGNEWIRLRLPRLSIQRFVISAAVWPQFQCHINKLWVPIQPPPNLWGSDSKCIPIEMSTQYSYSTSVHAIDLSCTVWPQCTTLQTETTDRSIGIGRLCYIGGLKCAKYCTVLAEWFRQY